MDTERKATIRWMPSISALFSGNENHQPSFSCDSMSNYYHRIKGHVRLELESANAADAEGDARLAFFHLERAHILGQRSTRLHVLTHWRMMCWGVRQRQCSEVFGQLWRIVGATLSTAVGLVPVGNTGGANVSGFRKMRVPEELQAIIDGASVR